MKKVSTVRKLILLIIVFIVGIFSLITLNVVFTSLTDKLDKKSENLKSKINIAELIVDDLYKIRSEFYEFSLTATNKKAREVKKENIKKRIEFIKSALYILEKGGTLQKVIKLNIAGHLDTIKTIKYYKNGNENFSLEAIDLRPKLNELIEMIDNIEVLLQDRDLFRIEKNYEQYLVTEKKINRFYKLVPPYFIRIIENSSRSLYEGNLELELLQDTIENEKNFYTKLEYILVCVIILIVTFLGYLISRQINNTSKEILKQEVFTRGILDAQANIVIVSDGEKMIDANKALVDFFYGFNSFADFKDKHKCICDFFENIKLEHFLTDRYVNGKLWFELLLENPHIDYKVAMRSMNELRYFKLKAVKTTFDNKHSIIIVSLSDITNEFKAQNSLKELNDNLEDIIIEKTKELKELNENLEYRVKKEIKSSREKDRKLIQQSRYASLGEMIGNIAHQWRQPLSAISSTASGEILQMELGISKEEDLKNSFENIMKYTQFLTKTIDDFRNFFQKGKDKTSFNILDTLNNTITLVESTYKNHEISIIKEIEKESYIINSYPTELSQVFLNILNNTKDVLIDKNIRNKYLLIKMFEDEESVIIQFLDNGLGIEKSIMKKIFDPYFTTKHKSIGTGIGLYMTKEIVEKHMQGTISVENMDFEIDTKKYFGACFTITLPKNS